MKKKNKGISRRSFLKTASAVGISAVSAKPFNEAHATPLRVPKSEYGSLPMEYVKNHHAIWYEKLTGKTPESVSAEKEE